MFKHFCAFQWSIYFDLFLQEHNLFDSSTIFNLNSWMYFLQRYFQKNYVFLNKLIILDISVDYSTLNNRSSSFSHLLQIIEKVTPFLEMYVILEFLNFCVLATNKVIYFFHLSFLVSENTSELSYNSFPLRQKSIN